MKTTILHSNCPWTTTKNTTMLGKNISGLSLWGWLVCVGIFSFNYVVDKAVGPLPSSPGPAHPSPSSAANDHAWVQAEASCLRTFQTDWWGLSQPWHLPPKIIKYEFPLLGGIFFLRIYEFQEKWPDSSHQPHWTRAVTRTALTSGLSLRAQSVGKSYVKGGAPSPPFTLHSQQFQSFAEFGLSA